MWTQLLGTIAGGVSGLTGNAAKKRQEQQQREIRAAEIEASPWTNQAPSTQIQYANPVLGDVLSGSASGFSMGQNINKALSSPTPPEAPSGSTVSTESPTEEEKLAFSWGKALPQLKKPTFFGRS